MLRPCTILLLSALLALTACAQRAGIGLSSASSRIAPAAIVPIYVATARGRSGNVSLPYSAARSPSLNFALFDIGIPPNHVPGCVETSGDAPDPARHMAARSYQQIADRKQFIARLDAALMQREPEDREIFIFVHGYNNNIADSIFRNAQIVHDFKIKSVPLHFAWASGGSLPLYVFDRDSAAVARGQLAETIEIAARTKARRIILLGHSMGSYVVMEALRDLKLTGRSRYLQRLGGVILAAPDIDVNVFQSQVDDIGELPQPFTVVVSQRDRALRISRRIAGGHPRVGLSSDVERLQEKNITVLDVSDLDGGSHGVFSSSQTLISFVNNSELMRGLLNDNQTTLGDVTLAEGASAIEGASFLIFLPARILGGATNVYNR